MKETMSDTKIEIWHFSSQREELMWKRTINKAFE